MIEERFAEGTPMEMLSTYHDVNGKLMMTHYCMLRNQPRMKLVKSTADSLTFDLAPTPGLNAAKDKHMHGATYTFIDANHFKLEGVAWENGKVALRSARHLHAPVVQMIVVQPLELSHTGQLPRIFIGGCWIIVAESLAVAALAHERNDKP